MYNTSTNYIGYNDDSGACYCISSESEEDIPKIGYSQYGSEINSYLLRDIDMVALTDEELNTILK